jgi:hypothetical protein
VLPIITALSPNECRLNAKFTSLTKPLLSPDFFRAKPMNEALVCKDFTWRLVEVWNLQRLQIPFFFMKFRSA